MRVKRAGGIHWDWSNMECGGFDFGEVNVLDADIEKETTGREGGGKGHFKLSLTSKGYEKYDFVQKRFKKMY